MRLYIQTMLLLLLPCFVTAQDTVITITPNMLDLNRNTSVRGFTTLGNSNGWIFRQGNNPTWANTNINTAGWKKLKPTDISEAMADKGGKVEGWFRIKIKLDTAFENTPLAFLSQVWGATEVYVDGKLFEV